MTAEERTASPRRPGRRRFLAWNLLSALAVLMGPFSRKTPHPGETGRHGAREAKFYTRLVRR